MEPDSPSDHADESSFDLPVDPSVKQILKKVDQGHLDRVNKEVGEHLTKILTKVNQALQRSEDVEEDPDVVALYTDEGRLDEIRRRAAVLESISIFVESSVVIQKDLERLLEWLTDWGDVSSDVEPEDIGVKYSDLAHWIAEEEEQINKYLESTRLCIFKLMELCSILTGALPPKEDEPKEPGGVKEGFWKFWREDGLSVHITEMLHQAAPWAPETMLQNEAKTAQKVGELLNVLQELASSPTSSKVQGALIFYLIGMIDNLSKALSLQCKQYHKLQASTRNQEFQGSQVNEQLAELTAKVQALHDKRRELEGQLRHATNEQKVALSEKQHIEAELKSLKMGALGKTYVGPPVELKELKAISSQISQKGVPSPLLSKRESALLEGIGASPVQEEGGPAVSTKDTGLEETKVHVAAIDTGLKETKVHVPAIDTGLEETKVHVPAIDKGLEETKVHVSTKDTGLEETKVHVSTKDTGLEETKVHISTKDTGLEETKVHISTKGTGLEETKVHVSTKDTGLEETKVHVSTKDTGLEETKVHLAEETYPPDASMEQPTIPPVQAEGETESKLEDVQELSGIPPQSLQAISSKVVEEGLPMLPADTGLLPVKESATGLQVVVPSSPEGGELLPMEKTDIETIAEEERQPKTMVVGEEHPVGLPSSPDITTRPPVKKSDLTLPVDGRQKVDLKAVDAKKGSQLYVVEADHVPSAYSPKATAKKGSQLYVVEADRVPSAHSPKATGTPRAAETHFKAKDVSEGVHIVLPPTTKVSSALRIGERDLETAASVRGQEQFIASKQQITDKREVRGPDTKTALGGEMEIEERLAPSLVASRMPLWTSISLEELRESGRFDEKEVSRTAQERSVIDTSISLSPLEEFQQAIHSLLEKKVASYEQVWGPDSRIPGVLPRDPEARRLYSITEKKIEDALIKIEENIRRQLGLEVAQTLRKQLEHRGLQAATMLDETLQRLSPKMGEKPAAEGHEQIKYLTEKDLEDQVNEETWAPTDWQSLLKCQVQGAKRLTSSPTCPPLLEHQKSRLGLGRIHSAKKDQILSVDSMTAPEADDDGVSQEDRQKKMICFKGRQPFTYSADHAGMQRRSSAAHSETKELHLSPPSSSKDTTGLAPDITTQITLESQLVTPAVEEETKERYWVDVKSQKLNLDLLNRAQRLSSLPPQMHDSTRNVILDILNTDPARLGNLFRKYTSFYFIQRVRQNVVSRLAKAKSVQDGMAARALYQVLERVDSYQRRILQRWALRQANVERSRRAYISRAIDLINKLRADWDLHLSPPFLTVIPIPLKKDKVIPRQNQKKLLPLKIPQEQLSFLPLPEIQKATDPGSLEISRRSPLSSLEKVWDTNVADQGFEITAKKALSSTALRQGGFPEVPRLLELDVSAIRSRALRAIQRRINESLK